MKENKYDDPVFFEQYSRMDRSVKGLQGAGEWHILQGMLPDFEGKKVLDLGCGLGWHCRYTAERGAEKVIGIDISEKMLEKARKINALPQIEYIRLPVEEVEYPAGSFDVVISSLTFHYIESFWETVQKIHRFLTPGGTFVYSVEHPVFTASGKQDWFYSENRERLHWPVDRYFYEGKREAIFLGEPVVKYHKTLTTYINETLRAGFQLREVVEAQPSDKFLREIPEMADEMRRPMILLISAVKP